MPTTDSACCEMNTIVKLGIYYRTSIWNEIGGERLFHGLIIWRGGEGKADYWRAFCFLGSISVTLLALAVFLPREEGERGLISQNSGW